LRNPLSYAQTNAPRRQLSQSETEKLVDEFCESKRARNRRVRALNDWSALETMEQHVYRQMEHKYGLRGTAVV
jgi:hypothetical protein